MTSLSFLDWEVFFMVYIIISILLVSCGRTELKESIISRSYAYEADVETRSKTKNTAVRTMVGGVSSGLFKSDHHDFGYYEISKSAPTKYSKLEFFGGVPLVKKCFNKNIKSYLSFNILDFTYCIEAKVKLNHDNGGLYISNARLEVLDLFEDRIFYIDPVYNLKLKISSFHSNESNIAKNPIESINFSVELFLDGPVGFDARSTDKFQIRADSEELFILQLHELK